MFTLQRETNVLFIVYPANESVRYGHIQGKFYSIICISPSLTFQKDIVYFYRYMFELLLNDSLNYVFFYHIPNTFTTLTYGKKH